MKHCCFAQAHVCKHHSYFPYLLWLSVKHIVLWWCAPLCRLHLALNNRDRSCLHYVDKINFVKVNQFIFIFCIFYDEKSHNTECSWNCLSCRFLFTSPSSNVTWSPLEWAETHSVRWAWNQVLQPPLFWCNVTPRIRRGLCDDFWGAFSVCCIL